MNCDDCDCDHEATEEQGGSDQDDSMMETDDHSHQAKGSVQVGSPMTGIAAIEIEGGEGETSDDIAEHLSRLVGEMSEHLPDDEDDENESPMKGMH